ncbi:hypothetical protein ACFQH2_11160 [Natronoarchaeum sp. GCM10025703]|uniref:hypothetical protein n=1 Tax=unclassified Natronoarchaeum TaxID=2620183 RepID=UPI003607FA18
MVVEIAPDLALSALDVSDLILEVSAPEYSPGGIEDVVDSLTQPELWLGALAGGAFGAALGALPAFVFTGFLVIAGSLGGGGFGVGVGFGPVFGPHISFAGGAAAAAYAASRGKMESGFDYHNGKDITFALGSRPDILAVGAAFGAFGLLLEQLSRQLALPLDPIPLSIVISALVHRLVFGYSVIGIVSDKADGILDMSPFEREETRDAGEVVGDGEKDGADRLAVEPWLPEMYKWSHVATIGVVAGLAAAVITHRMIVGAGHGGVAVFAGFGISAASLLFLNLGIGRIPVTHHMTLPAATAYAATNESTMTALGVDPSAGIAFGAAGAIIVGAIFGLYGALAGEFLQRIFYAHSDTHFDPPAASIVVTTATIGILFLAGIFAWGVWVPGTV